MIPVPVFAKALIHYLRSKSIVGFTSIALEPEMVLNGTQWVVAYSHMEGLYRIDVCDGYSEEMMLRGGARNKASQKYHAEKVKLDELKKRRERVEAAKVTEEAGKGVPEDHNLILADLDEEIAAQAEVLAEVSREVEEINRDRCVRRTHWLDKGFLEEMLVQGVNVRTVIFPPKPAEE